MIIPTIEIRNEADSLLEIFQIKESGFGKVEFRFRNQKTGKYSFVLNSNGDEYKRTAFIKESLQWPVGNFDMQKP